MERLNRIIGLPFLALCFAIGCSSSKKIEVGDTCTLNSDCKSPLTCSMGKCHEGCRASSDCQPGQTCTKVSGLGVCQLPAEAQCNEKPCGTLLICAPDLRCRSACQTATTDCMDGQVCVQSLCADKSELDVITGQLPQKVLPDGGLDAQLGAMNPEAGRADTAKSPDLAPASPDLGSVSPDTAILSPDTAIMSLLPDAQPLSADTRPSTDGNFITLDSSTDRPPTGDAPIDLDTNMPDVSYSGPCGQPAMPCCAGDSCTTAGWTCLASKPGADKTCQQCGGTGQLCCPGSICTGANTNCTLMNDGRSSCEPCGGSGFPCCAGDTCLDTQSECKQAPDAGPYAGKTCQQCGGPGQACCSGGKCRDIMAMCESGVCCGTENGPCCAGDLCTSPNQLCALPSSGSGTTKTCQSCGMPGQTCCAGKKCQMDYVCLDSTLKCTTCGEQNGPCCTGNSCRGSGLSCTGGTCTCTPPPAPVVTATPGNGRVVLTWPGVSAPDGGNTVYYSINRSVTAGSRYSMLGSSDTPTYTDTGVSNGVTYYYTVSTNIGGCASAQSAEVSAKPSP